MRLRANDSGRSTEVENKRVSTVNVKACRRRRAAVGCANKGGVETCSEEKRGLI